MRILLPSFKSPIVTVEFLRQVKTGIIKLPKIDDVRPFVCIFPPTIKKLREELVTALQLPSSADMEPEILIEHIEKRSADKEWLLQLLHLANPRLKYFQRDYRPEVKKNDQVEFVLTVNNEDGFFSQATMPQAGKGRANLRLIFSEEERAEIKKQ